MSNINPHDLAQCERRRTAKEAEADYRDTLGWIAKTPAFDAQTLREMARDALIRNGAWDDSWNG
jgi:hypothetical protein